MQVLVEEGFEVFCVCEPDEWAERLRELGFKVWPIGMGRRPNPLQLLLWSLRFWLALRRNRVEIVHTHNAYHGIAGRLVARLAGVPIVVQTVHNWYYLQPTDSLWARLYELLERAAGNISDMVFFLNKEDYVRAEKCLLHFPAGRRRLIGNGVDVAAFQEAWERADRDAMRATLSLEADQPTLAIVARLEPPKDHLTFLRAFARLVQRVPRARALIIGYGLRRPKIELLAERLGVAGQVQFLGYRDDVPALLKASDLLVLSTTQEGFGRSLVEGMLAGLPVVASDVVGVRDVVRDGINGLLVAQGDDKALAETMEALLENRPRAAALGQAARSYAEQHFDEQPVAMRVVEAYRELLRDRGLIAAERPRSTLQVEGSR
jgi:glycosyltransferase involved in cell wall biosynthesis